MTAPSDSSLYGSRDFDELLAILSPNSASNNAPGSANNSSASNSIVTGTTIGAPIPGSDIEGRIASSASGRSSRSNRSLQHQFQQQQQIQRSGGWTIESVESFADSMSLPAPQTTKSDAAAGERVRNILSYSSVGCFDIVPFNCVTLSSLFTMLNC